MKRAKTRTIYCVEKEYGRNGRDAEIIGCYVDRSDAEKVARVNDFAVRRKRLHGVVSLRGRKVIGQRKKMRRR